MVPKACLVLLHGALHVLLTYSCSGLPMVMATGPVARHPIRLQSTSGTWSRSIMYMWHGERETLAGSASCPKCAAADLEPVEDTGPLVGAGR